MKCCVECFIDIEIKSRITGLKQVGNCNICEAENVFVYDTHLLSDDFEALLDTYKPESILPDTFPKELLKLLKDELVENWNIFNLDSDRVDKLIKVICQSKYKEEPKLFEQKIGISQKCDSQYLEQYSLLGKYSWESFAESIKLQNRFHSKQLNTSVFLDFLNYLRKPYKKGSVFYRARISNSSMGYRKEEMFAPQPGQASAGRVNPEGISYLYLGSDKTTTLNEVRAGLHDFVSIATFKLNQDIDVVDLTRIDKISAFSRLNPTQHAVNRTHLVKMSRDIAKPLRRQDSHLEYLPTQYLCEFIKMSRFNDGTECSGIEYGSTMSKEGYNIAIFNSKLFECIEVDVYDVQGLKYTVDPSL